MKKIKMILTNGFDPDPRVYKEARTLVDNGFDVEVLCWDRENKYLDKAEETLDGIKVKRFFPKSMYGSGIKQFYPYYLFIKEIKVYLKGFRFDILHAHDVDGTFAATLIKKDFKLIWDMHEFYDGSNNMISKLNKLLAPRCFKKSDGIIIVSEEQKRRYSNKIKRKTKVQLIANAAEARIFKDVKHVPSDKLRISFIGSVRDLESLKFMMDIADKSNDLIFNIHGGGHALDKVKDYAKDKKNIRVTGQYNYDKAYELYSNTDLVYSVYSDRINIKGAMANKFFEAILSEVPIVANKNTYNGDLIDKLGVGFTIDVGNDEEMLKVISLIKKDSNILKEKKRNILEIKDSFSWEEEGRKLVSFYKDILN